MEHLGSLSKSSRAQTKAIEESRHSPARVPCSANGHETENRSAEQHTAREGTKSLPRRTDRKETARRRKRDHEVRLERVPRRRTLERNQISCACAAMKKQRRSTSVWRRGKNGGRAIQRRDSCQHDGPSPSGTVSWAGIVSPVGPYKRARTEFDEGNRPRVCNRSRTISIRSFERSGFRKQGQWFGETEFKFRFQL